jgi:hypothetical protein
MKIAHPENWAVIAPQKKGESLTIAPQGGVTGGGVGYGVVINGAAAKQSGMSIDALTDELVRSFEAGQGGMKRVGTARHVTVAGVSGRAVDMQSVSPLPDSRGQEQAERDRLVTIPQQDGSVIFLVFVAPAAEFDRLRPAFDKMLSSVQF